MSEQSGVLQTGGAALAFRQVEGRGPAVVFLSGFGSDLTGTKAQHLADWAQAAGRRFLRFDYFGCGASGGAFEAGAISRWRADALAVLDELATGPAVLVGSSMGGWLACLAAMARPDKVRGLVLIAPAADFVDALMRPNLPAAARKAIERDGVWTPPGGVPVHRALLEDAGRWNILGGPVPIDCPVRVIQGERDDAVPWRHALELFQLMKSDDAVFSLVKDGDHRLSRPQDLARIVRAVEELLPPPVRPAGYGGEAIAANPSR